MVKVKKNKIKFSFNFSQFAKFAICLVLVLYFMNTFITQSVMLKNNNIKLQNLNQQIKEENNKTFELQRENEKADMPEIKEEIARKRDGLAKPNEIIFIDHMAK